MPTQNKKKAAAKKPAAKKRAKTPPPRDLTKPEAFYVEGHYGQKTAEQLAADTGAPVASIERHLKRLADSGFEPKPPVTAVQQAGFAVHNGTVSMTKRAAEVGDDFRGVTADGAKKARPVNHEFLTRRVPSIHIINPNLPARY